VRRHKKLKHQFVAMATRKKEKIEQELADVAQESGINTVVFCE